EPDESDTEPGRVRAEVVEEPAPRHPTEAAHLPDDGAGIGRQAGELLGHGPMIARSAGTALERHLVADLDRVTARQLIENGTRRACHGAARRHSQLEAEDGGPPSRQERG